MRKILIMSLVSLIAGLALDATPIQAKFTGVNGTVDFGYYVGPYSGTLDGENVPLYCVDFANEADIGQTWTANLSHIDTQSDLANTRYGGLLNATVLYQEAAWLTEQYALNPGSYGDIQATIWRLFDSSAPMAATNYWLTQARANYSKVSYDDFLVVTNLGPVMATGQVQEFLTVITPTMPIYADTQPTDVLSTPEPRLMGAAGIGLIAAAMLVRRFLRRKS